MTEQETLARQLHEWYLEATAQLHPESYNSKAQKPYDDMTEEQKFMDRYIAGKILKKFLASSLFSGEKHEETVRTAAVLGAQDQKNLVDNGLTMNDRFDKYASNSADFFQETKVIEVNQALALAKTELTLLLTEIVVKKQRVPNLPFEYFVDLEDIISIAKEWGIELDQ